MNRPVFCIKIPLEPRSGLGFGGLWRFDVRGGLGCLSVVLRYQVSDDLEAAD